MKIIKAKSRHLQEILNLYELLYTEMAHLQPDNYQSGNQDIEFLQTMIQHPDCDILLATENTCIFGFALVMKQITPAYSCVKPHAYATLMDLVVKKEARGLGFGNRLLQEVEHWAKQRNLDYVELNVLHENHSAQKLYEKHGYQAASHILQKHLK